MTTLINIDELSDENLKNSVFWSYGNFPTQTLMNISYDDFEMHFKILYLLSEKIFASASFFYESDFTRKIFEKFKSFFYSGEVLFFTQSLSYSEHGERKIANSPKNFDIYTTPKIIIEQSKLLDDLGYIVKRDKTRGISKKIIDLWLTNLSSEKANTLGYYFQNKYDKDVANKIIEFLKIITENYNDDFVWEYIKLRAENQQINFPVEDILFIRKKLLALYIKVSANIIRIENIDCNFEGFTIYDPNNLIPLFDKHGMITIIKNLNTEKLKEFKNSDVFGEFKHYYQSIIKRIYDSEDLVFVGRLAATFIKEYQKNKSTSLIYFFDDIKIDKERFKEPIDNLKKFFDTLNKNMNKYGITNIDKYIEQVLDKNEIIEQIQFETKIWR